MKLEKQQLSEQMVLSREALEQTTTQFKTQCGHLEDRVSELSQQNAAIHEEAEKVCLYTVYLYNIQYFILPRMHALCMCVVVGSAADTSEPDWRGCGHDAH